MSQASDTFEAAIMLLLFNNTTFSNFASGPANLTGSAAGNLSIALHTGDPGEAGTQLTSECDYTDYARETVVRSGAGWTCTAGVADNAALITFTVAGATTADSVTWFSVGSTISDAQHFRGQVIPTLVVNEGITPEFAIGALDITVA